MPTADVVTTLVYLFAKVDPNGKVLVLMWSLDWVVLNAFAKLDFICKVLMLLMWSPHSI